MKLFLLITSLLLVNLKYICNAEEIQLKTLSSAASIRATDFSNSLRSLKSNSVCFQQTSSLESNVELTRTLENVMLHVESAFHDVYFGSFCRFEKSDIDEKTTLECVVDYNKFSADYVSLCADNKGKPYPVSFLTSCQDANIDLQIELLNIPSCFGRSCASSEINEVMDRILVLAEESLNDRLNVRDNDVQCEFFHNYDMKSLPVNYVLSVGNDGNVQLVRITSPLPTYIWGLVSFGAIALCSLIVYKMRRKRKDDKYYTDDTSLTKCNFDLDDEFQETSYQKRLNEAKKEVSKLVSTVQIFYEKIKTSYDDVPFDEAIEIKYN